MGITVQPGTQAKTIEELRELQGGAASQEAKNAPESTPFAAGSDRASESIEENGGSMVYRPNAGANHTSGTISSSDEHTLATGRTMTSDAKTLLADSRSAAGDQDSATSDFNSTMQGYNDQIMGFQGIINGKNAELLSSGKIIDAQTAKQEQVAAWIENTNPAVEDLQNQLTALEQEALGTIPQDLGIDAETLEDAIAQLSEMIDSDKLEELTKAQQRSDEISKQLETTDPEDSEYDSLVAEQETLQTTLQDPENETIMRAADALATIADYSDAMTEIATTMTELQAEADAKMAEGESIEDSLGAEQNTVNNANNTINSTNKNIEDTQGNADETCDDFKVGYDVTMIVADSLKTTGGVATTTGEIMSLSPCTPVATAGFVLKVVGVSCTGVGGTTETAANVAAGIHYEDSEYFRKAAVSAVKTGVSVATSCVGMNSKITDGLEGVKKGMAIVTQIGNGLGNAADGAFAIVASVEDIKAEKEKGH